MKSRRQCVRIIVWQKFELQKPHSLLDYSGLNSVIEIAKED